MNGAAVSRERRAANTRRQPRDEHGDFVTDTFEAGMPVVLRPDRRPGVIVEKPSLSRRRYLVRMECGAHVEADWLIVEHA